MRRTVLLLSVVGAMIMMYAVPGLAQTSPNGTLDAHNTVSTYQGDFYLGDDFEVVQQFTAENSGNLTSAQVELYDVNAGSELTMEIVALDDLGEPAIVLASTTVPDFSIPDNSYRTVVTGTFGSPATVTAGTKYGLLLKMTGSGTGGNSPGGWMYTTNYAYSGGDTLTRGYYNNFASWQHYGDHDAGFSIYVDDGIDTTAPTASISFPASGSTVSGVVPVSANASDNAGVSGVQFKLDGSDIGGEDPEAPYSASWDTTTVSDGNYTLTVVARDAAENTTTSEPISVKVDNTVPVTNIDSGPTGTAAGNSASFSFSSEAGAKLACKLDDEPDFVACSSPKEYANLPDGNHTFSVRATDEAGNSAEAIRTWTVDTTVPNTTITSGPSGTVKSNSASFSFTSEGSDFRCSLDGGPYSECNPPRSYFNLANGTHTFKVKATDVPGNTTPATRTWTVDTVLPTVSGMSPKNASITTDVTPTIKATVRDDRTNLQKADMKLYVNGVLISPTKYSYSPTTDVLVYNSPKVAKGKKTVRIVATDAAKNVRSTSWYFTIR